ncbi:NUDIX domain-containing protein [Peribacillus frigoritolerans]|nr:NUDIX domain-containing protein [Peribacillus frigoritolerans]
MTRINNGETQVLVFQHPIKKAGIQIPKGTVKPEEDAYQAVIRGNERRNRSGKFSCGEINNRRFLGKRRWCHT